MAVFVCLVQAIVVAVFLWGATATAQQSRAITAEDVDSCASHLPLSANLTSYTFGAVSSPSSLASQLVTQGVMLCIGFNHDEAIRSFAAAAAEDPDCAIAYWGTAYALSPDLNRNLTDGGRLARAQAAVNAAEAAMKRREPSPLEAALVAAMAARFPAERTLKNGWAYDVAYARAMTGVAEAHGDSADALALATQAWMTTSAWNYYQGGPNGSPMDWVANALDWLHAAMALNPEHPLALHLHIHLVEPRRYEPAVDDINATADTLRALISDNAIGIGHLLHMPAHAYLLVGRWHDATVENVRAVALDRAYMAACPNIEQYNPFYVALYFTHKHNFLLWTASEAGQSALAIQTGRQQWGECHIEAATAIAAGQQARMPWLYQTLVRFGQWDVLLREPRPATRYEYVVAFWHHSRAFAMAASPSHGCSAAAEEVQVFAKIAGNATVRSEVAAFGGGDLLDLANLTLAARMTERCGASSAAAIPLWQQAVAAQDALAYDEPPTWPYSLRPCLGQALMDAKRFDDAKGVFEDDFTHFRPGSGWALWGLWQAALASGDSAGAASAKQRFDEAWSHADVTLSSACY